MSRRSYGSGSLFVRRDARGAESWYGKWYAGGRRIQRKLGPKRRPGTRDGLTRAQAERELRRLVELVRPPVRSRLTLEQAGERYLAHVEHVLERKVTTVSDYRYMLTAHLVPFFGAAPIERIESADAHGYLLAKRGEGLATKTITNHLVFLHGLFAFAVRRGWTPANPVDGVERPRLPGPAADVRFLTLDELDALLRSIPDGVFAATDRALYLSAATTGLRQGELLALRWLDVDWRAARLRVRRTFTRGRFGTPKSRRSTRSVPITDRLQEWMGHRDAKTTQIYADYAPSEQEGALVERAFEQAKRSAADAGRNRADLPEEAVRPPVPARLDGVEAVTPRGSDGG